MTQEEFDIQISRLKETWPNPNNWGPEKIKLIWTAVNNQNNFWFERLVTTILANQKQAPTPQEFINAERLEARKHFTNHSLSQLNSHNNKSVFNKEEIEEFWKVIKLGLSGKISQKESQLYADMVYQQCKERGVKLDYHFDEYGDIIHHKYANMIPEWKLKDKKVRRENKLKTLQTESHNNES